MNDSTLDLAVAAMKEARKVILAQREEINRLEKLVSRIETPYQVDQEIARILTWVTTYKGHDGQERAVMLLSEFEKLLEEIRKLKSINDSLDKQGSRYLMRNSELEIKQSRMESEIKSLNRLLSPKPPSGYEVVAASHFEVGLIKDGKGVRTWFCQDFDGKLPTLDHPKIQEAIRINEENEKLFNKSP